MRPSSAHGSCKQSFPTTCEETLWRHVSELQNEKVQLFRSLVLSALLYTGTTHGLGQHSRNGGDSTHSN